MGDFCLAPMGHVFTRGVCFDTRYALLGNRSALGGRRLGRRRRAVPVGPPPSLALEATLPIRRVAVKASPWHRSGLKLRLVLVAHAGVSTKYTTRRPPPNLRRAAHRRGS